MRPWLLALSLASSGATLALLSTVAIHVPAVGVAISTACCPDPFLQVYVGLARSRTAGFLSVDHDGYVVMLEGGMDRALAPSLRRTGESFDFTDPNGRSWHVVELASSGGSAWAVHTAPRTRDAATGMDYNFVLIVDLEEAHEGHAGPARILARGTENAEDHEIVLWKSLPTR